MIVDQVSSSYTSSFDFFDYAFDKVKAFSKNAFEKLDQFYNFAYPKNPVTEKREFWFIPLWFEKFMGSMMYHKYVQNMGGESHNKRYVALTDRVGNRLLKQLKRQGLENTADFTVVNNVQINAFSLPGGKIAIFNGLLKAIVDGDRISKKLNEKEEYKDLTIEDKLAAVLSHELIHADARHTANSLERMLLLNVFIMALNFFDLIGQVIGKMGFYESEQDNNVLQELFSKIILNIYFVFGYLVSSKRFEYDADKYGMHMMKKANYNPKAALWLQEYFRDKYDFGMPYFFKWVFEFFSTHPMSEKRLEANRKTLEEIVNKV